MASGGAATVPATIAILRNQTAADRRARVFGVFGACMGLAAAIGPLVGGELTERFGWRAVFAANLPVIAVSLLLVLTSHNTCRRAVAGGAAARRAGQRAAGGRSHDGDCRAADVRGRRVVARRQRRRAARRVCTVGAPRSVAGRRFLPAGARRILSAAARSSRLQNMAMYPLLFQLPVFFDQVRHLGRADDGSGAAGVDRGDDRQPRWWAAGWRSASARAPRP